MFIHTKALKSILLRFSLGSDMNFVKLLAITICLARKLIKEMYTLYEDFKQFSDK